MKQTQLSVKIKQLKKEQPHLTTRAIGKLLGCHNATVGYHLMSQKKRDIQNKKHYHKWKQKSHPYEMKLDKFKQKRKKNRSYKVNTFTIRRNLYDKLLNFNATKVSERKYMRHKPNFTVQDIIQKYGENPKCYLTGEEIDISDTRSYNFDHIIPRSKGGENTLDNLGICIKEANTAKCDMTPDQLFNLCKKILEHNGFDVTPSTT